ncbi:ribonuclease H-like domain-containing protein [Romboutsia sp. 1001216sp1]|uniref:ribonuclease H-like domain-containing protein n=1 Tax=Romboutsia TaxID=1501226 RepID=UPI000AC1E9FE|nr:MULTISPECIES: ribonuclease H-like domain-containing protein [Romboutsia]MDB8789567.1 ribonuclease H-like domain-containing protein [Romboutsia sp. 1001216sp1]MDB8793827.1 ribonuclease H-like domain-containing protein [Romboutsia sp. 1001216sp1]MDB8796714.1 ribonuclease H-like domain-containing protein [Romboutsia sp. 1001216sp1]MDB8799919.1 ribonuclease H-like domain-containing protein [Romboutsia sp. 1001216sp1]MDB8802710.1 ribonuclease H-like domain-containing protein [Romboutsia sp. 1001
MEIITKTLDNFVNIPSDSFVFDIETTGLSPKFCKVILIGILFNKDNKTIIKQYFAQTEDDEKDLLLAFINDISTFDTHITFNGLAFDIPFLNSRFNKYNIDFELNKNDDIDILNIVRPFKGLLSLSDCKLKTIEKYIGISREDTISGKESVKLYKEFVSSKSDDLKSKILLHNYEDIYYLGYLYKIKDILEEKLKPIVINNKDLFLKLIPLSFKINNSKLTLKYNIFDGNKVPINIYSDNYSILSDDKHILLSISLNKGIDKDNNIVLFYQLNKIIPLKVNDNFLDSNIYNLCEYIIKKELKSL